MISEGLLTEVVVHEELIQQLDLNIHNREGQPPTFRGRAGAESNIDIAMSRGNVYNDLTDWRVVKDATTSAHNAIEYNINLKQEDH